jgi:hypothetical protein
MVNFRKLGRKTCTETTLKGADVSSSAVGLVNN